MEFLIVSFKVIKAIIRKCALFTVSARVKLICLLNGVKHGKIRSIGCPYIDVDRFGNVEIGDNAIIASSAVVVKMSRQTNAGETTLPLYFPR